MLNNLRPLFKNLIFIFSFIYLVLNVSFTFSTLYRESRYASALLYGLNQELDQHNVTRVEEVLGILFENTNTRCVQIQGFERFCQSQQAPQILALNFAIPKFLLEKNRIHNEVWISIDLSLSILLAHFLFAILLSVTLPLLAFLAKAMKEAEEKNRKIMLQEASVRMAKQVAHDIRSPVVALRTALHYIDRSENEPIYELINDSANRIMGIASDLMAQKYSSAQQDLTRSLQSLLLQKKFEFPKAQIEQHFDLPNSVQLSQEQISDLERVVSNVINNSVEASKEEAWVSLKVCAQKDQVEILISDRAGGMPEAITKGWTTLLSTKGEGRGFGLSHLKSTCKKWNWKWGMSSVQNQGTEVSIAIQCA